MSDQAPGYFAEGCWQAYARATGSPPSGETVAAYDGLLGQLARAGVTAQDAATIVRDQIETASGTFAAGMRAFHHIVGEIDTLASVLEGAVSPPLVYDRILVAKVALAELYHALARLGPIAGIGDLASEEETARNVAAAEAELAQLRGAAPPAG
jgi:hypothetical protein